MGLERNKIATIENIEKFEILKNYSCHYCDKKFRRIQILQKNETMKHEMDQQTQK